MQINHLVLLLVCCVLTACGGGGGSSSTPSTPPPTTTPPPAPTVDITGPQGSILEKTAVTLTAETSLTGNVTYTWQQLDGKPVEHTVNGNQLTFQTPGVFGNGAEYVLFGVVASDGNDTTDMIAYDIYVESKNSFEDNAELYTTAVFSAKESYLQLTELARQSINNITQINDENRVVCYNGGLETITHNDTDSNGLVSTGDSLRVDYEDCLSSVLDAYVQGSLTINITLASVGDKTIAGTLNLDDLVISDRYDSAATITVDNIIEFTLSETNTTRNYTANTPQTLTFSLLNVPFLQISQLDVVKSQDLRTGRYSITVDAELFEPLTNASFTVDTITPISGFFNEYPNIGEIRMTDKDSNEVFGFTPNNVIDSDNFNLVIDGIEYKQRWNNILEGTLFSLDGKDSFLSEYRVDNFQNLGVIDNFLVFSDIDAPLVRFAMNRPIARILETEIQFRSGSFIQDNVPATISIDGGLVTLTPTRPLLPATNYTISSFSMVDEFGTSAYNFFYEFMTSDAVIPKLTASSRAYRQNDYPILDASESEINQGTQINYLWEEISDVGIVFTDVTAAITSISIPNNVANSVTDDIEIRLTVSNESGRMAQTQITLSHQSTPASYISLDSDVGDYIGQGQMWFMDRAVGFNTDATNTSPNELVLNYDGIDGYWSMHIQSPDDGPLAIGVYEEARRWPFQPPGVAGFDFSGDGRGCNTSSSSFEILEIAYDAQGVLSQLSVDFVQNCESATNAVLRGQVRFNSSLRINPEAQ